MILLLVGCEQAKETFGMKKSSPDEFAVVPRAPLSIPPEFGLRPPVPGAKRPQEKSTENAARQILVRSGTSGGQDESVPRAFSRGEAALLGKAGAENADPGIRDKVSRESAVLAQSGNGFVKRLMFWQKPAPPGEIIDPTAESRRIDENLALGDAPVKGTTPVIERREKGWLEGLFN